MNSIKLGGLTFSMASKLQECKCLEISYLLIKTAVNTFRKQRTVQTSTFPFKLYHNESYFKEIAVFKKLKTQSGH